MSAIVYRSTLTPRLRSGAQLVTTIHRSQTIRQSSSSSSFSRSDSSALAASSPATAPASASIAPKISSTSSSSSSSSGSIAGGPLAQIIRDSIRATGPMPLSRYMQFCLSHPTEGYYSKGDVFGRKGDFITSPEISQVFGEMVGVWLLSRYLADVSKGKDRAARGGEGGAGVRVVELGPGRGTLMDDILRTLTNFPVVAKEIKSIHLVENSLKMRDVQQAKLAARLEAHGIKVEWLGHIDEVPQRDDIFTMLVAHEFFDAMPINLFERETGYREVLVDTDPSFTPGLSTGTTSGLRLALSPEPTPLSQVLPSTSPRFANLPIGSRIEIAQDSYRIVRQCGELINGLGGGAGLVVDYGGDRAYGDSFRAFRNHKLVNVFDTPGSSDLTANVDFAYLKEALEGTARPLGPLSQMQFLLSLGMGTRVDKLIDSASSQQRKDDISGSAKRLVDPLGMGAQYQVMGIVPRAGEGQEEEVYPFIAPPAPAPETAPAARGATKQ